MDKKQAEQALDIIRGVIEHTREDLVAHNWGLIWLIHAFTNATAFVSIGLFVERHDRSIVWYLVPLAALAVVNIIIVAICADRDRGVRSYIELQLHGIWVTFIIFTLAVAAFLHVSGSSPKSFCSLMAITTGISFSSMAVVFYRRLFVDAGVFLVLAILCPLVVDIQWYLFAAGWWAALFVPGLIMFRERQRRGRDERNSKIL